MISTASRARPMRTRSRSCPIRSRPRASSRRSTRTSRPVAAAGRSRSAADGGFAETGRRPPPRKGGGEKPGAAAAGPTGAEFHRRPAGSGRAAVGAAERREALAREFAELQWDLGGLAYEMAGRDHFRLDVLIRQAAKLQQVDAELSEVERLLKLEEAGAAGVLPVLRSALRARGGILLAVRQRPDGERRHLQRLSGGARAARRHAAPARASAAAPAPAPAGSAPLRRSRSRARLAADPPGPEKQAGRRRPPRLAGLGPAGRHRPSLGRSARRLCARPRAVHRGGDRPRRLRRAWPAGRARSSAFPPRSSGGGSSGSGTARRGERRRLRRPPRGAGRPGGERSDPRRPGRAPAPRSRGAALRAAGEPSFARSAREPPPPKAPARSRTSTTADRHPPRSQSPAAEADLQRGRRPRQSRRRQLHRRGERQRSDGRRPRLAALRSPARSSRPRSGRSSTAPTPSRTAAGAGRPAAPRSPESSPPAIPQTGSYTVSKRGISVLVGVHPDPERLRRRPLRRWAATSRSG